MKPKRILAAVDFSKNSDKALASAAEQAAAFGAELVLFHVAEIGSAGYEFGDADFGTMEERIRQKAAELLDATVKKLAAQGLNVRTEVKSGWPFGGQKPFLEIVEAAKRYQADLIVMPTHARTGIEHVLLGSTTERVVRHAPCAVLVVR
jgi:nucleotide-binding universal stress UspA family protein